LAQLRRILLYIAITVIVIYGADYLAARTNPLGAVEVQPFYAIHLKDKKVEFDFNVPPESDSCVQSFAPHLGYPPCWYLKRHASKRIDE
jgi:hypothetical protein